jgi:hypothetical protein
MIHTWQSKKLQRQIHCFQKIDMAQDQRGEGEIMAAFTSGNYTLSAAEQAQALADRDTEAANQVPPPPFQPPPYDLRTFPQLNLHYAPNILSNYFNCQFSLNEKLPQIITKRQQCV